jgi:hypothetical protein
MKAPHIRTIICALSTLCLVSCASVRRGPYLPTKLFVPFDRAEHAPYEAIGAGRIEGQAFLRQRGGGVVTCAGSTVTVSPATDFSREILAYLRASGDITAAEHRPARVAFDNLKRTTECDAQGSFVVTQLPAGLWIVSVSVVWHIGSEQQGGVLQREIQVPTTERTLLTDQHYLGRRSEY